METEGFRSFLQSELIRRCESNGNYSLRAFALSLGMNHATLSSILSGKRPLTPKSIAKIGSGLNLSKKELDAFLDKEKIPARTHQDLALEAFAVVAHWYHDAILELTHTKNFVPDSVWVAQRLGINPIQVRDSVERLQRLELLEITEDGGWRDLSRNNTTNISNDLTSAALRKLQQKILEQSQEALKKLPRTERDHTSLAVAMERSDLPEVKGRIKQFRYELVSFIERKQAKPDEVYQFAFSVFPLTKVQKNQENKV